MAKREHARDVFLDLAKTWIKLARDLRHSQHILATWGGDGLEPHPLSPAVLDFNLPD
jgi:hypothetical protein